MTVDSVSINDVSSGVDYDFDTTRNKMTINNSMTSGDVVEVDYTFYNDYSSKEIKQYVKSAISYLSVNNYTTFLVEGVSDELTPVPEDNEKNLIAVIAAVLIKPGNRSYRLPDISITVNAKDLPTDQKISRIIGIFKQNKTGTFTVI